MEAPKGFLRTSDWQVGPDFFGEDPEQSADLCAPFREASEYIGSFRWAPDVEKVYLAYGAGRILALFLFCFSEPVEIDRFLWVVVGDVPSAYSVTDEAKHASAAMEIYCELMEDWARAVMAGLSLDDVFPVDAVPTSANAEDLLGRLKFIREIIVPSIDA